MNHIQVDTSRWLYYIKNDTHEIHFEMLISLIATKLELNFDEEEAENCIKFRENDFLAAQSLMRMEMIEKALGDGYRIRKERPKRRARINKKLLWKKEKHQPLDMILKLLKLIFLSLLALQEFEAPLAPVYDFRESSCWAEKRPRLDESNEDPFQRIDRQLACMMEFMSKRFQAMHLRLAKLERQFQKARAKMNGLREIVTSLDARPHQANEQVKDIQDRLP